MTLSCNNITKRFGKSTIALNSVSLKFTSGIYGLLGANGAGKTTLMQILTLIMSPDKGEIIYNGKNIDNNRQYYRSTIGYWPQECNLPENFRVKDILLHISQFKNIKYEESEIFVDKLLIDFNLYKKRVSLIKNLSGGEKQRLGISQAFLGIPKIVILDEPTRGLDIDEQNRIYEFLLSQEDKIIIISSHIVRDIEATCSSLIIMGEGDVLYSGKVTDITQYFAGKIYEEIYDHNNPLHNKSHENVISIIKKGECQVIKRYSPGCIQNKISTTPNLEDIYLYLFKSRHKIILDK
jgi:ABC-2 type transport system ATP-binding protein